MNSDNTVKPVEVTTPKPKDKNPKVGDIIEIKGSYRGKETRKLIEVLGVWEL